MVAKIFIYILIYNFYEPNLAVVLVSVILLHRGVIVPPVKHHGANISTFTPYFVFFNLKMVENIPWCVRDATYNCTVASPT